MRPTYDVSSDGVFAKERWDLPGTQYLFHSFCAAALRSAGAARRQAPARATFQLTDEAAVAARSDRHGAISRSRGKYTTLFAIGQGLAEKRLAILNNEWQKKTPRAA